MERKKKILIVDDEESIRMLLKTVLNREDFQIETAGSGSEGMEIIEKSPPDLIILDIYMQGKNGVQICRQLKQDEKTKNIPIVIYTVADERIYRFESKSAGADSFVTKSSDLSEIVEAVKKLLLKDL